MRTVALFGLEVGVVCLVLAMIAGVFGRRRLVDYLVMGGYAAVGVAFVAILVMVAQP